MWELLYYVILVVVSWCRYFIDEKREKKGLPPKYRQYARSLTDESNMTEATVEMIRGSYETIRDAENERLRKQRESYVYDGSGVEMDGIAAKGVIAPHAGEKNEYEHMDNIAPEGMAPPVSGLPEETDGDYAEMESL